jgi:hypothetical protein
MFRNFGEYSFDTLWKFLFLTCQEKKGEARATRNIDAHMNLTLPADLIWTVAVTPLEEQLPQPTRTPPQPISILKCVQTPARASQSSISSP